MIKASQARQMVPTTTAFEQDLARNDALIRSAAADGRTSTTLYTGGDARLMCTMLTQAGYTVHPLPSGAPEVSW